MAGAWVDIMFDEHPRDVGVFDYDEIANHLLEQGLLTSPAELHGCLTGLLGAGVTDSSEAGLAGLAAELDLELYGELDERVQQLYQVTLAALEDEDCDFNPLLPDDEVDLAVRTEALAGWCKGFVSGYAQGKVVARGTDAPVAADSAEALRGIAVIAQASLDDESTDEELENSYAEIVEYVRIAALNVFMDGHVPDPESDQEADPPQLH